MIWAVIVLISLAVVILAQREARNHRPRGSAWARHIEPVHVAAEPPKGLPPEILSTPRRDSLSVEQIHLLSRALAAKYHMDTDFVMCVVVDTMLTIDGTVAMDAWERSLNHECGAPVMNGPCARVAGHDGPHLERSELHVDGTER